jgi:beta-1,4-mannosyltransferase
MSPRPAAAPPVPLVVASVPADHPYVRHLAAPAPSPTDAAGAAPAVVRLPDPDPDHPADPTRVAQGRWWPPVMLRPEWVAAGDFEVMHVHFGFDDRTPAQLRELVAALRARRRGLVLTVHDLRNPHHADPALLRAQLDVLLPAADALVTLTDGAADEVLAAWGRRPTVLPHPHVVDLDVVRRVRAARDAARSAAGADTAPPRVGVAVKDLRANTDVLRLLPALAALSADGVRPVVSIHRSTHEHPRDDRAARLVAALDGARDAGTIELVVHEPLDDAALWSAVAGLDAMVLPYRFGTHSGWLEMCHDLGTSVVAPDTGHYAAQGADATYATDADAPDGEGADTASVVAAVHRALAARATGLPGLDADGRHAQRVAVAAAHDAVYRTVLRSVVARAAAEGAA